MQIEQLADKLGSAFENVAIADRPVFIRGWIAAQDEKDRVTLTALLGVFDFQAPPSEKHLVVLVHGIRTHAVWQEAVKQMFDGTGVTVIPIGYGFLDVVRFLIPLARGNAIKRAKKEFKAIKLQHPNASISVIAHSFGTYLITKILCPDQGIRLKRLILCGSIIPVDYDWGSIQGLPHRDSVLNDVGSKDAWPVLANTVTWGFGPSGTYGFKQFAVTDRFHNLSHSDFFSDGWVRKFWLPFIRYGEITPSDWEVVRPSPPYWMDVLTYIHLKYLLLSVGPTSFLLFNIFK